MNTEAGFAANPIPGARQRDTGVDFLRIIALLLVITSHIVHTLQSPNPYITYSGYVLDLSAASRDVQRVALSLLAYLGVYGNAVFFLCSAWYLQSSDGVSIRKWLEILLTVWLLSASGLVIALLARKGNVDGALILKSLLPNLCANNWYISCYLLFYPAHAMLNRLIHILNQRQLLRASLSLCLVYCAIGFIANDQWFFPSPLILWLSLYLAVGYLRAYSPTLCNSIKANTLMFACGAAANLFLVLLTNVLGLKYAFFRDKLLYWNSNSNPFLLISAFGLLNLMRLRPVRRNWVSRLSRLSLLGYLIHQNLMLRMYLRPRALQFVYEHLGYRCILLWTLLLALGTFVFAISASLLFDRFLRPLTARTAQWAGARIRELYIKIENRLLK